MFYVDAMNLNSTFELTIDKKDFNPHTRIFENTTVS